MRALTIWQPYATLIAIGAKQFETRSWAPSHSLVGQRIAIHAGLDTTDIGRATEPPFARALAGADLPRGFVVATATLAGFVRMTEPWIALVERDTPDEHAFGWFADGRVAWRFEDVEQLGVPVKVRGGQQVWTLDDALLAGGDTSVHEDQGRLL